MRKLGVTMPGGTGSGFQLEGHPDGVRFVALNDQRSNEVAHLALHFDDLSFADECLKALDGQSGVVRSALWQSAIGNYFKCFKKSKARHRLDKTKIYSHEPLAISTFDYLESMRDKHFLHDENGYLQGRPGAVLNGRQSSNKIAEIVTFTARADILGQENFTNLRLLIEGAKSWVISEQDRVAASIIADLERMPYDELLALPEVQYRVPTVEDAAKNRQP